jgi:CBS-domain-containing membrane protein
MRDKEVRRFPVFNKEGRLVGLLSLSDFAGQADQEYTGGTANRQVTDAEVAALDHTAHMPRPIDASRSLTNSFFR